jgi:S-adenosylmethionine:tRNA ribosyltransferase-isomerase
MNASYYDFVLPKELIAQAPTEPRDSCRLMVCSVATDEIMFDDFFNLARYLPEDSVLVLNDTKVVPARLRLNRLSGGAVRILFLFNEWKGEAAIKGLPDKGLRDGEALFLDEHPIVEAVSHANEEFTFKLLIPGAEFEKLCVTRGETPLPPYIRSGLDEADLREKYQTLFAANPASVGSSYQGETRLFIKPLYQFKVVDGLITNLHLPRTSLIMLLDAFLRFKGAKKSWRDLYAIAIREKIRFYSFGDSMLVI